MSLLRLGVIKQQKTNRNQSCSLSCKLKSYTKKNPAPLVEPFINFSNLMASLAVPDSPGVPPSATAHELFRGFSYVAPVIMDTHTPSSQQPKDTARALTSVSAHINPFLLNKICLNQIHAISWIHDLSSTKYSPQRHTVIQQDNYSTVGGDGNVGSARYEPALLPPCPTIRVLNYSNCQRSTHSHF